MKGLFKSLTKEQRAQALAYRGPESHGGDKIRPVGDAPSAFDVLKRAIVAASPHLRTEPASPPNQEA